MNDFKDGNDCERSYTKVPYSLPNGFALGEGWLRGIGPPVLFSIAITKAFCQRDLGGFEMEDIGACS